MAAEKTELRGLVSNDLSAALDAIAFSRGMERHAYVVSELEKIVIREAHAANVLHRLLRGNPYGAEPDGLGAEPRARSAER
jgi:hypothetical protein